MRERIAEGAALVTLFLAAGVAYTWPLAGSLATRPDDLAVEIRLPAMPIRHLRLVRLAAPREGSFDLFTNWLAWGAHEVEVYGREGDGPHSR